MYGDIYTHAGMRNVRASNKHYNDVLNAAWLSKLKYIGMSYLYVIRKNKQTLDSYLRCKKKKKKKQMIKMM